MQTDEALKSIETGITPIFKWITVENVNKSEQQGHRVMEQHEIVECRIAGDKNYVPHFPANSMWKSENGIIVTYAERWSDQYRAFKEGNPQEASGTPLEMLAAYGVSPEQQSLCRALKIYSIETLFHLEGQAAKSLGFHQNVLKEAARKYMADNTSGKAAFDEIQALKAQIAALESCSTVLPPAVAEPEVVDAIEKTADAAAIDAMSDEEIKAHIKELTGVTPRGNPSHANLVNTLMDLMK